MKGLSSFSLALFLLAAFFSASRSAPKGSFQRRNWTPQAMLYLKGTRPPYLEGRRFISEDPTEAEVFDTLHLETRSQNTEKLSVDRAAAVLLNFLQQARDGADENPDEVYFQELPVWKRAYF
ncbi:Spexin [Oryzias melastigma]|uniref:Spexin n=1 Tax=Oryzias melastigma TaxID=30732 RepID=A0A834C702_ORYME|nr:Spexin [Oryzias melastigma]